MPKLKCIKLECIGLQRKPIILIYSYPYTKNYVLVYYISFINTLHIRNEWQV